MENGNTGAGATEEGKTTQAATEEGKTAQGAAKAAAQDKELETHPRWKKFFTLLGEFNSKIVLRAYQDVGAATDKLVEAICLIDNNAQCEAQYGKGWVWDGRTQRCVRGGTE